MKRTCIMLVALLLPAQAAAVEFIFPVNCKIGNNCFVQNYVDHDSSDEYRDYTCGRLSYNGHKGTDIRLPNLKAMHAGVNVLAAADGTVKGLREGEPDRKVEVSGDERVAGKECGNGVLLGHEGGYETQYCHMKKGSVRVKEGDKVIAGAVLGQIGLSGETQFPHVHFEVRKAGAVLDPFTGDSISENCGKKGKPLWNSETNEGLEYVSTAILQAGFTDTVPPQSEAQEGKHVKKTVSAKSGVLVFWGEAMGILPGDEVTLRLLGPDGETLTEHTEKYDRSKAQIYLFIGKKNTAGKMEPGTYVGDYVISREKQGKRLKIATARRTVTVK